MGKAIKALYLFVLAILLMSSLATAANYDFIHNPFTGRQDRSLSLNQSGFNFTASYFFGNGSLLTDVCLSDGTNCAPNAGDTNETVRFNNLAAGDCPSGDLVIGVQDNGSVLCATDATGASGFTNGTHILVGAIENQDHWTNVTILESQIDGYAANTTEQIQDSAWSITGGTQTLITVTYQDVTNDVDFVVTATLSSYTNDALFIANSSDATLGAVNVSSIQSADWTNITITESQVSDLTHTTNTDTNVSSICANGEVLLGEDITSCVNLNTTIQGAASNTTEQIQDSAWSITGGTQTLITVTYQDATNDVDFVVTATLSSYTNDALFIANSSDATLGAVNVSSIQSADWTNITITESQVSDLTHTTNTDTNVSSICANGEVLMGDDITSCVNLNTTTQSSINLNNITVTAYIDANAADTNETVRFNNLAAGDCAAGDLVIGVQDNGSVLCATDSTGSFTNGTHILVGAIENQDHWTNVTILETQINGYAANDTEEIQDSAWAAVAGGTETLITVTYQDVTNDVDFIVTATLSSYTNDALFIANATDATTVNLNVTSELGLQSNRISNIGNITFDSDLANHQIWDNTTCVVILGDTATLQIC